MSYIAPSDGAGMSLGQAVKQAVNLGYAEPGADSPYEVIRGEAEGDIPKKTAILFNKLGLAEKILDWKSLKFDLRDEDISEALAEASIRRFIVSIYSKGFLEKSVVDPQDQIIGGFNVDFEGWTLIAGFQHVNRNPLLYSLARITGPGAGMVMGLGPDETDGVYNLSGPGAGVSPTVNTMIDDYVVRKASIGNTNE
jgi:homoserine dehydrogenase